MRNQIHKRIRKEIQTLKEENHLIDYEESPGNYRVEAVLNGPEGTVFEGGEYKIVVTLDMESYPFTPPSVEMTSRIFHPNFSGERICVDLLDDNWSSINTLFSIVKSLENLMADPNPDSALDSEAASAFNDDPESFEKTNKDLIIQNQADKNWTLAE